MEFKYIIFFIVVTSSYAYKFGQTSAISKLEPIDFVLDIKNNSNAGSIWKFAPEFPQWFEYYHSTEEFGTPNNTLCGQGQNRSEEFMNFPNVSGIWLACKDPTLPTNCVKFPDTPCYPFISFDQRVSFINGRSLRLTFALLGTAVLRLNFTKTGDCFDYSTEIVTNSSCIFNKVEPSIATWTSKFITLGTEKNETFSEFKIDMIALLETDAVLIDKLETTTDLLCDYNTSCPTTTTTTTTSTTASTTSTTASTTPDYEITDEEGDGDDPTTTPTTHKPAPDTSHGFSLNSFNFLSLLIIGSIQMLFYIHNCIY